VVTVVATEVDTRRKVSVVIVEATVVAEAVTKRAAVDTVAVEIAMTVAIVVETVDVKKNIHQVVEKNSVVTLAEAETAPEKNAREIFISQLNLMCQYAN
jgi:hypothetical protein